jgi:hypothetical protein
MGSQPSFATSAHEDKAEPPPVRIHRLCGRDSGECQLGASWRQAKDAIGRTPGSQRVTTQGCMPETNTIVGLPSQSYISAFRETFTDASKDHTINTYNHTLSQRRSDGTLRGSERHKVFEQAVVEGQLPRVRNFLRIGIDLDDTGTRGLTVLHRAVLSGHEDIIHILIEAGADVNAISNDFGTPLCLAALKGMVRIISLLLATRRDPVS